MRSVWGDIVTIRNEISWRSTCRVETSVLREVVDPIISIVGNGNEGFYDSCSRKPTERDEALAESSVFSRGMN